MQGSAGAQRAFELYGIDGGDTWTHLDTSLPGRVDWNKGAFAGDRLVVGTGGVGVYWIDVTPKTATARKAD